MGDFQNNFTKNEKPGRANKINEGHNKFGSVIHPLVKKHPITKKNFYILILVLRII